MKSKIKFHILRWTPKDIINGFIMLRNQLKFTLHEALETGLTKIDIVTLVQHNRYIEISMIYIFQCHNKNIFNDEVTLTNTCPVFVIPKDEVKLTVLPAVPTGATLKPNPLVPPTFNCAAPWPVTTYT